MYCFVVTTTLHITLDLENWYEYTVPFLKHPLTLQECAIQSVPKPLLTSVFSIPLQICSWDYNLHPLLSLTSQQ